MNGRRMSAGIHASQHNRAARTAAQMAAAAETGVPFLRVELHLQGRSYVRDLEVEARVEMDPDGLSQALADLPGLFAFYAAAEAEARAAAKRAEVRRSKKHAELYTHLEASQARTDDKGKRAKPTVDAIKSLILKDPTYEKLQQDVIEAERQLDLTTAARQTIQMKKDVTLAAASNYRAELDAQFQSTLKARRDKLAAAHGQPT